MNKPDFLRWFNRGFWKAFTRSTFAIRLDKRIRSTASRTVNNAFRYEASNFAQGIGNALLQAFLIERIGELSGAMQSNIVE